MAGEFVITIDAAGATAAFKYMADRAADLTPAMDEIEQMLLTSTDKRFEDEVDPDGKAWTPLAPSTVKAKAKAGHEKMLQWSSRLRRSIVGEHDASSVTIGTNVVYAAIHQFGGSIKHYAQSRQIFRKFVEWTGRSGKVHRELQPGFVKKNKANFASWHEHPEHDVTIPARAFVGISQGDVASAVEILQRFVSAPAEVSA